MTVDVDLCPLGEDIQIIIDSDGYFQRIYTMDLYEDVLNVLYAYLPVEETNATPGDGDDNGGGGLGEDCIIRTFVDSITVTDPSVNNVITLTYLMDDMITVEIYNQSLFPTTYTQQTYIDSIFITNYSQDATINHTHTLSEMISVELYNDSLYNTYGGWIFVPSSKYTFNATATIINSSIMDINTTMMRISYYYMGYSAQTGGWIFVPANKYTYTTTNITILPSAMDSNTIMARANYYYEDCGTVDVSALYNLRVVETITSEYSSFDKGVEHAFVVIKKYINTSGIYVPVTSLYTDANGYVNVYLVPTTNYKIFITKDGYSDTISSYIPNPPNQYGQTAEKVFRLVLSEVEKPIVWIENVHTNVTWDYEPKAALHHNIFTFWFNVTSSDCKLEWYRMETWHYNKTTKIWVLLDSQNESDACGGSINFTIPNATGRYSFKCFYKKEGYDEYEISETGSVIQFYTHLKETLVSVPDYAWFLIIIILMIVGMGFFSYYFGINVLTGYIGLGIFAMMLLLKDITISIGGGATTSGWLIWTITFLMYTMGWYLYSKI